MRKKTKKAMITFLIIGALVGECLGMRDIKAALKFDHLEEKYNSYTTEHVFTAVYYSTDKTPYNVHLFCYKGDTLLDYTHKRFAQSGYGRLDSGSIYYAGSIRTVTYAEGTK